MPPPPFVEPLEFRIAPASLSIADVSMSEGNAGTKIFSFDVTLTAADPANPVTVHYKTMDDTAAAGSDYVSAENDLTFAANPATLTQHVDVTVNGDLTKEQFERFFVDLSNPSSGTTITKSRGIGTIKNDDGANLTIDDATTAEGNAGTHNLVFTVRLDAAVDQNVTVHYATADKTATQPADYTNTAATLMITSGSKTGTINVPIVGDTTAEADETFFLNLSNAQGGGAVLTDAQAVGTIVNDDSGSLAVAGKTATYTDENGDLVKVTASKGVLLAQNFSFDATGQQLQTLDLSGNGSLAGASLTFTAVKQNGVGDEKVKVGYIKAQSGSGDIDLGAVKLPGDLGKIDVGDNASPSALKSLTVDSLGKNGLATGAPDLTSHFRGSAGSLTVLGDVQDASIFVNDAGGKIGSGSIGVLKIGGGLKGGAANNSGEIFFTGTLGRGTVGSVSGGAGNVSGAILGSYDTLAKISNLTVGGLTGSTGNESGEIAAAQISVLTINGDVMGNSGNGSGLIQSPALGRVTIHGSLMGGAGFNSGEIFGDALGVIVIDHDVHGGSAGTATAFGHSGTIEGQSLGSLNIHGSLLGGDFVNATHTARGNGSVFIKGDANSIAIGVDVKGGSGDQTGDLAVRDVLQRVTIGRDFIGHDSGATKLTNSGYIQATRILSLVIGRNFEAGSAGAGGIDSSGAIRADADLGTITIKGDLVGQANNAAIISAVGQANLAENAKTDLAIKSITVTGKVDHADILAGYGPDTTASALGEPVNADASIGTVKIGRTVSATNLVAGAIAGSSGFFGDTTDARISGTGTMDRFGLFSKISMVIIGGHATGDAGASSFGVVAQNVGAVKVLGAAAPLTAGPSNDLAPKPIDGSADFNVVEVV